MATNFSPIKENKMVVPLTSQLETIEKIRENYPILISITALDQPQKEDRFTLIYNFLSIEKEARLEVKIPLTSCLSVFSIVDIYPNANWYEREVWDLFGIPFKNHPDLRRIVTDYGFIGHPLRKDFPLTGYQEITFINDKVSYMPLDLAQPFRDFDSVTGWIGPLPGDEKASK